MSPCVVQGDLNLLSLGYSFTFCACLFAYFLLECSLVQSVSPSRVAAAAPPPSWWSGGGCCHTASYHLVWERGTRQGERERRGSRGGERGEQ